LNTISGDDPSHSGRVTIVEGYELMIAKNHEQLARPPRVSIGIPVYNGADFLAEAFECLLAQTYVDFELIVSDNGSTDETESICRRYAAGDARIHYYREETNRGACWNFNRVFELARGEYFKFAAHDDLCQPTFLASCIDVLDSDSAVVCCHTQTAKIDPEGKVLNGLPDPTDGDVRHLPNNVGRHRLDGTSPAPHRRFADVLLNSGWSVRCFGVIRSAALRRTGMLQAVYGYEKVLMGELALWGRYCIVPETLFFQRVHPRSSSSLTSAARQHEIMAADQSTRSGIPRLRLLAGHLRAITRMPLSAYQRVRCLLWVAAYLFQVRKWKSVFESLLRGTGTGGANKDLITASATNDLPAGTDGTPTMVGPSPRPDQSPVAPGDVSAGPIEFSFPGKQP
jgi:hypothetical protein